MHIYPHFGADWLVQAVKRLNIGYYCSLCARAAQNEMDLCLSCKKLLCTARHTDRSGRTSKLCAFCGDEILAVNDESDSNACCQNCSQHHPLLKDVLSPYRYAHPIDGMIKRLKYGKDRQLARVLGGLLADAVTQRVDVQLPELLVPMPLHSARQRFRGFNQAQDIAYWAGKRLQIPMAAQLVSRTVDTGSLAGLNRQERQHRILGAFRAEDALLDKRVAIVDDVLTTGASARELAREIYDSGAESVELWVLARTSSLRSSV